MEDNAICPFCGKPTAILVESHVNQWHCSVCHREWPKENDNNLPNERYWKGDEGELRH